MRTVTLGLACSLDCFIARPGGEYDWLRWDKQVAKISADYWKTIDMVVMGRKTYDVLLASGTTSYPGARNYVFSRLPGSSGDPNVEFVAEDVAEFVGRMKRRKGKGICIIGGGEIAGSLLNAAVLDEIVVNVHPVILGKGIPLFPHIARQIDLERQSCKPLSNGNVVLTFAVKKKRGRGKG